MTLKWSKLDHLRLTSYVDREARGLLALKVNILDSLQEPDGVRKVVEEIYNKLLAKRVQYALEPSPSHGPIQYIRTPSEIMGNWNEGTCLDLALLFCGVCLGCDLIPVLIVLEGHALVAVSRKHNLRQWNRRGKDEMNLFENVKVGQDKAEQIKHLISSDAYMAVECTGFAQSWSLSGPSPEGIGRQADGTLTFERATGAGKEHFQRLTERQFQFALDIVTAHRYWGIDPVTGSDERIRAFTPQGDSANIRHLNPLPYLLDRSEQEQELRAAVLKHRTNSPHRPLVFVVHGSEVECHGDFLNRLEKVSIPKILRFWYPEEVERIPVFRKKMMPSFNKLTDENWEYIFQGDLAAAIVNDREAPHADIIRHISDQELAVLIDARVLSEKLENVALHRLNHFFEFWNRWPDLSENLLLIICLSLKYKAKHEARRRWYQVWKSEGLNNKLRRYVRGLESSFEDYENLHGVCLSELQAISQEDAEVAINDELVSQLYGFTERDVIRIYNQPELCTSKGCISMYTLLEQFSETLRDRHK